jgi:hypothetical protein
VLAFAIDILPEYTSVELDEKLKLFPGFISSLYRDSFLADSLRKIKNINLLL